MKAAIIGNGAAALSAIEAIRGVDGACEVTVVSKEKDQAYTPCFLANFVAGEIAREKLYMRGESFYEDNRINALLGVTASGVNTDKREIMLSDGNILAYDKLLLAAGSSPIVPKIDGIEGVGVHFFRTLTDAVLIKEAAEKAKDAVVMGAGFIGLEIAEALSRQGVKVIVVEKENRALPRMLDGEIAMLVEDHMRKNGVNIITGQAVNSIERNTAGGLARVTLDSGDSLSCDMLVVSIGVKPNVEMLGEGAVNTNLGVLVNDRMQTSIPSIYAAGDITEIDIGGVVKVNPIHINAVESGRVAGGNMAGAEKRLDEHVDDMNVVTLFGVPILSLGARSGARSIMRSDSKGIVKIYESEEGVISGAQLMGDVTKGGLYLSLIKRGIAMDAIKNILSPRFNFGMTLYRAA